MAGTIDAVAVQGLFIAVQEIIVRSPDICVIMHARKQFVNSLTFCNFLFSFFLSFFPMSPASINGTGDMNF